MTILETITDGLCSAKNALFDVAPRCCRKKSSKSSA